MAIENLLPVSDAVIAQAALFEEKRIFKQLKVHSRESGLPKLEELDVALIGVREMRGAVNLHEAYLDFSAIRTSFYGLFPGNWDRRLGDLGDLEPGETLQDTYFALRKIVETCVRNKVIPIVLGGSQDLTYALYRAFDDLDQMVNLVSIDSQFDLGNSNLPITHKSYLGKIIIDQPYNLFNYSNLGYQTFYNSQEEIDLIERLYFDAYRLGNLTADISRIEPVLRDADVVSFDLSALQADVLGFMHPSQSNGFNGREACAIARYAGLSDRVTVFGIFEYLILGESEIPASLIAQLIWYFVEGVNFRIDESLSNRDREFLHFNVPVEDQVLSFYRSKKSDRWWIEIPFLEGVDNKLKRHTLLPCTQEDYRSACNQEIPERWYKAKHKNET